MDLQSNMKCYLAIDLFECIMWNDNGMFLFLSLVVLYGVSVISQLAPVISLVVTISIK